MTRAEPVVHDCCGCSCYVCANGHDMSEVKVHAVECMDRFYAEQELRRERQEVVRLDIACPRCGRTTIVALMLENESGRHQHTLYHCIFYRSGGSAACMWSGWTVPDSET